MLEITTLKKQILIVLFLYLLLLVTYLTYSQGLANFFILDDYPNLEAFKDGIYSLQDINHYLGDIRFGWQRPLSRLSFLIDDNAWPSNAALFKHTNILIHLLTGIFLFLLSTQLFRLLDFHKTKSLYAGLIVAGLWMLHPLNTSTVFYVIQRMAQLSTLFILIGLCLYIKGRLIVHITPIKGYLWMSTGIGLFGILSFLSKENGILLSPLALVLEYTLISYKKISPPKIYWKLWQTVFLIIPFLVPFVYFATHFDGIQTTYETLRPFSLSDRLLTQSHVIIDYLNRIFLPQLTGLSLFHDDYPITRTLFENPLTILKIIFIVWLIFFALLFRKKYPVLSFGILWFFVGHLLESTGFALEIYFEHRNYLPMMGPLFSLVFLLLNLIYTSKHLLLKKLLVVFLIIYVILTTFLQIIHTQSWGDYRQIVTLWYNEHPGSKRAGAEKIMMHIAYGSSLSTTTSELDNVIKKHPESMYLRLLKVNILCSETSTQSKQSFEKLFDLAQNSRYSHGDLEMIDSIRKKMAKKQCSNVAIKDVILYLQYLTENPSTLYSRYTRYAIYKVLAESYIDTRDLNAAILSFDKAYKLVSVDTVPLAQAILLSSAALYKEALEYIEIAKNSPIKKQADEVSHFETLLKNTINFYEKK